MNDLTILNLGKNQIKNLPESIGKLSNLLLLYLEGNQIKNLPESIGDISLLSNLDLGENQIENLPESIGKLKNLIGLNLGKNKLKNLPESIGNFSELTLLNLRENQLINIPESISMLSKLIELILSKNKLSSLPNSITNSANTNFYNLTCLDLRDNKLSSLPESIINLPNLRNLYLSNNPLEKPPPEVAKKDIELIRQYFRQLKEEGKDYIYEAKLLIVGEAMAGKTTLAKKIENPNYELDINEKFTKGIDITKWNFPLDNKQQFKVNIWDFGGQIIYHHIHQFFFTKRSLYTLVVDTPKEDTDFYYWLNVVELLSNNSPLIIVKNEKGDRHIDIDENSLRGRFENLKESLATNLKDNRGLNAILKSIEYHIAKLPHVGSALPKTWKRVRETLEQDKRNYISLEEYLNICQDNGFTRLEDKLQLSGYLHDLGVCLHFQDSPLLKNTVILKPEWGTDAVYKVLDDKQVINNLGEFTTNDLDNIWSDEQYLFKQAELLELMMRFKLCYQIPVTKDTYIAPQLLTKTKPTYDWDTTDNLILRYTYEFMPKGIITQLIVAMHQHIYQQKYVWRSGVLLDKDETLAEVIEYYDKREITLRVIGKLKRKLMTEVTYELDKINYSFYGLKYQKLIPCNCQTCSNLSRKNLKPHFYEFEILKKFLGDRQDKIQCQKSYQMVNVLSLIDDVFIWNNNRQDEKQQHPSNSTQSLLSVTINNPKQQQGNDNIMTKINQTHSGSGDNVARDKKTTNIYNSQDLTQAAADIQALLKQLEETYPTNGT